MSTVTVANFGDSSANGVYTSVGTHDGETVYRKGSTGYWLRYSTQWMPWSYSGNYYIIKINDVSGTKYVNNSAIPIEVPEYRIAGNVATSTTESWVSTFGNYSGEATTGTVS